MLGEGKRFYILAQQISGNRAYNNNNNKAYIIEPIYISFRFWTLKYQENSKLLWKYKNSTWGAWVGQNKV